MKPHHQKSRNASRRGMLLPMVLVVIVLLTLGAYAFTEQMLTELESTVMYAREVQARAIADSGVELTLEMLSQRAAVGEENLYHDPAVFQQTLLASQIPRGNARFSVVAPIESNPSATMPRFGLMNESGKININELLNLTLEEDEVRNILTGGPEYLIMPMEMADLILDFIDAENPAQQRQFGMEAETNKNAPLESLDELLSIEGVTREMLYGEDANQNGMLDPGEDVNGDGVFQPGWVAYLTVHSMESNLRADGTAKINLNQDLLTDLYDAVAEEFDQDKATFIVAYRMNGPVATTSSSTTGTGTGSTGGSSGGSSGGSTGGSSGGGSGGSSGGGSSSGGLSGSSSSSRQSSGSGGGASSSSGSSRSSGSGSGGSGSGGGGSSSQSAQSAMQAVTGAIAQAASGGTGGAVTRGGLDLSAGSSYTFSSLYDLVGSQVTVDMDGKSTTLDSPWTDSAADMQQYLPLMMDSFSLSDDPTIMGRVNINQARYETLIGLPGMNSTIVNSIINQPMIDSGGGAVTDMISQRSTTGWLVMNGQVDLETMRQLDQFITARGDVFRAQVIGHFDSGGPLCRLEAIIDATTQPPKLIEIRDLTDLGRGFSQAQLIQQPQ